MKTGRTPKAIFSRAVLTAARQRFTFDARGGFGGGGRSGSLKIEGTSVRWQDSSFTYIMKSLPHN
jgi:hypothetical protein